MTPRKWGESDAVSETLANPQLLAVTVHGPAGAVDLVVPPEPPPRTWRASTPPQGRLQFVPDLHSRVGPPIPADRPLAGPASAAATCWWRDRRAAAGGRRSTGVDPRAERPVPVPGSRGSGSQRSRPSRALAGWCACVGPDDLRTVTVAVLARGRVLGVLPVGRLSAHRMVAAPAFAAAAAFAVVWAPSPSGCRPSSASPPWSPPWSRPWPAPSTCRATRRCGSGSSSVSGCSWSPGRRAPARRPAGWSGACCCCSPPWPPGSCPAVAVDVPDQYLIDLERLAVTAWSARERPHGRRGRMVVPPPAVAHVAARAPGS